MSCRSIKRNMDSPTAQQNKTIKHDENAPKTQLTKPMSLKFTVDRAGRLQRVNALEEQESPILICIVSDSEIRAFLDLLDDSHIRNFLSRDSCYKLADKYLLAMVFAYFKRAKYSTQEFTRKNFFLALYLAHYVEEDDEDEKYQILPWAVGDGWRWRSRRFLRKVDHLWSRMDHRAIVSLKTCEEYISIAPDHPAWLRIRSDHHSGAIRYYGRNCVPKPSVLFGPDISPPICRLCHPRDKDDDRDSFSSFFSLMTNSHFPLIQEIFEKDDGEHQKLFVEE